MKCVKRKPEKNIESLLLKEKASQASVNPVLGYLQEQSNNGQIENVNLGDWTNQEIYTALQLEDPVRASRLHPNDRRKVIRSLQVRFQTGKKHSELIAEQCGPLANCDSDADAPFGLISLMKPLGGPLRFPNSICLWIQAEKEILNKRIEDRVENMIKQGLKRELDSYMDILKDDNW